MAAGQPARSGIDFSAFRDSKLARELIERIRELVGDRTINLMEVCGTHTVSIGRYGFRSIMPAGLKLLSGPGCPVCVTANRDIDHAIALSNMDGAIISTFGDMMRVPGSSTSLAAQKAAGRDIRIVYSPLDALDIVEQNPERPVIFMGVGFETTTPTIAAAILEADARGLQNFSVYCAHKTTPPALRAIANDPETTIDGYRRGVNADGNPVARQLVEQVFEPCDTTWRGLGPIAASGLAIRPEFSRFDARTRFDVPIEPTVEPRGCRCGDVLRGAITPSDCPLFGHACTPEHPVGPCMVSSEGSCAAYFRYRN